MPKVSVIIPTYNRAGCITDAINSVLKQTYPDFELLIVDDGSTDNTPEIVNAYIRQYPARIRYMVQAHKNAPSALNRGIQEAQGEYIAFLDSDDFWFPDKLEEQINVMDKTSAGLVHAARYEEDTAGNTPLVIRPQMPARNRTEFLEGRTHISMTVLTPKKVLQKAGMFDEAFTVTYDTDMRLRIAKDNEIVFIDKPSMTVRKHGDGQLTSKMIPMFEARVVIAKRMLEDQDIRVSKRWWRKKLLKSYYQLSIRYFKQRNYRKSMGNLMKAASHL